MRRILPAVVAVTMALGPAVAVGGSSAAGGRWDLSAATKADPALRSRLAGGTRADVFVMLKDRADLTDVRRSPTHQARVRQGYEKLTDTARRSQEPLRRMLAARHLSFTQFWLVNTILVRQADAALVAELSRRPDVSRVRPVGSRRLTTPVTVTGAAAPAADNGVEWNIARIGAPRVWSAFGRRGEGVVVANIDTGVAFRHPALVDRYRGRSVSNGVEVFDHNYNWFDPSRVCGNPSVEPCDNNGHGTHTMGTMVGDTDTDHIGVAPGATWIAAKGCESNSCSDTALLAAGQWVVAPTDLTGANPRPDRAPDIVNNSWGGAGGDTFYEEIVRRWVDVGIFPVFANGNAGPSCGSADSPGDNPEAYAVGAFDADGAIAGFSGRGASALDGGDKPNISAPGVSVRSSIPGTFAPGDYASYSGTSMATPHVAGTVALMWSAAPALAGDVATTRALLDRTAGDVVDFTCGGTAGDNNVWGEGMLDAYSAVAMAPRGQTGVLTGTVTDAATGQALAGVSVTVAGSDNARLSTATGTAGDYRLTLPVGTYTMTLITFGYGLVTVTVTIAANQTTTRPVAMTNSQRVTMTGRVLNSAGIPVAFSTVALPLTPLPPATTDADGRYRIANVPLGGYRLTTTAAGCAAATQVDVTVPPSGAVDVTTPDRRDGFGNRCHLQPATGADTTTVLPLSGDDVELQVPLPFAFPFFGANYTSVWLTTNGNLNFQRANSLAINGPVPSTGAPNAAIYPLWDDLLVDDQSSVRTGTSGTIPNRQWVVEWRNVAFFDTPGRATFQVVLNENGGFSMRYLSLSNDDAARGGGATVGFENATGTDGIQVSLDQPVLRPGTAISVGGLGGINGYVTTGDGHPMSGVDIAVTSNGAVIAQQTTDATGTYRMAIGPGGYSVQAHKDGYAFRSANVTVAEGAFSTQNFVLLAQYNTITGQVLDDTGAPVAGAPATVYFSGTFAGAVTDADGRFRFTGVSPGTHNLEVDETACTRHHAEDIVVDGDETVTVHVTRRTDTFGHTCATTATLPPAPTTVLPLTGDDASATVALPFSFPFYGRSYTMAYVSTNGMLNFLAPWTGGGPLQLTAPPYWTEPNAAVYAFWDDLVVDDQASVVTSTTGTAPNRAFTVEWRNVLLAGTQSRLTFGAVLGEDGTVTLYYRDLPDGDRGHGGSAWAAIENEPASDALGVSVFTTVNLHTGLVVRLSR
jgi:subtilisin family serine protease